MLAEENQAAPAERFRLEALLFIGHAVERSSYIFARLGHPFESFFVRVEVVGHELKQADDRVVENLLVAKVHPDGAHYEAGDAGLHPELPPGASRLHVAGVRWFCLFDSARDDAVGFQPDSLDLTHDVSGVWRTIGPPPDPTHQSFDVNVPRFYRVEINHQRLASR